MNHFFKKKRFNFFIKILIFHFSFFIPAFAEAQNTDEYFDENYLRYDDFVYRDSIRSVLIHRQGWELSYPVIKLNSAERLMVRFDELGRDTKDYMYTVVHCDANWQPSDLFFNEYAQGFEDNDIRDYNFSFNTFQDYINYHFTIPNDDLRLLLSGNYLLLVYEDYDREKLVLTRRFSVVENKITITPDVKQATLSRYRFDCHEVDFTLQPGFRIMDPFQDLKVVVTQNNRWDNAKFNLTPSFTDGNSYTYNYEEENVFKAGNEFRQIDLKNVRFKALRTDSIYYQRPFFHFQIRPDDNRRYKAYSYHEDLNGKRLIKYESSDDSFIEADYVYVHFTLPWPNPVIGGNLYLFGAFSDWRFYRKNMLTYNFETQAYEATLFLKQGFYNYHYVFVEDGTNHAQTGFVEGNHYQTENDYLIYVYYRDPSLRYDQLLGFTIANSLEKM